MQRSEARLTGTTLPMELAVVDQKTKGRDNGWPRLPIVQLMGLPTSFSYGLAGDCLPGTFLR